LDVRRLIRPFEMTGRAQPLYPGSLDVNLFCDRKGIINLDAEVPVR
jgi:hypothetical protein